jgi:hypothetical protein
MQLFELLYSSFYFSFRFLYLELPIAWASPYFWCVPVLILTEFATITMYFCDLIYISMSNGYSSFQRSYTIPSEIAGG